MKFIRICHYQITSPLINPKHDSIRIMHLTDLHLKRRINLDTIIESTLEKYNPSFVALTGDYVCYDGKSLPKVTKLLNKIKIPKYATLGNHDHWYSAIEVTNALEAGGCTVLRNKNVETEINGEKLSIIGIDDKVTKNHDPIKACENVVGKTRIVLSHVGDVIDEIKNNALILSGHTHAGQISIPVITKKLLKYYGLKYVYGFYQIGDQMMYISSGIGESVPIRFRARCEICIFDLKNGKTPAYSLLEQKLRIIP